MADNSASTILFIISRSHRHRIDYAYIFCCWSVHVRVFVCFFRLCAEVRVRGVKFITGNFFYSRFKLGPRIPLSNISQLTAAMPRLGILFELGSVSICAFHALTCDELARLVLVWYRSSSERCRSRRICFGFWLLKLV